MLTTCESASVEAKLSLSSTSSAKLNEAHHEAFDAIKASFQFVKVNATVPKANVKPLRELCLAALDLVAHLKKTNDDPKTVRELKFMEKTFNLRELIFLHLYF